MIRLTAGEIAAATGGALHGVDASVTAAGACVDSRAVLPGSIFVAVHGERVDGHDFAAGAIADGAALVLSARPLVDGAAAALPCVVVDDPVLALGRLAAWVRRERLTCAVVAVTGSSGKTSTKDLIAAVLARMGATVSPAGSFNTEVGLPMTVLSADETTRYLVLEMGMRGLGHIAYLADIAQPDVGVLVNVGSAHMELLGSREAIAAAKGELIEALGPAGVAVLYGDDAIVRAVAHRTSARTILFGESADCGVRATNVRLDDRARPSFTLVDEAGATAQVSLNFSGEHYVANATAAAAVALSLGANVGDVGAWLRAAEPVSRWRMEVREAPGGYTVVNDAYNANPESMRAALKTLAAMRGDGRTWAVLGEMRELGDSSLEEHDAIGRLAVRLDISRLVCVGDGTRVMHLAASNEGSWGQESVHVPDADAAIALLQAEVQPGDVVLVKASRSVGLEKIADALLGAAVAS